MNISNEVLWFLVLLLNFGVILLLFRFFGRIGLFLWIPIVAILANIQVLKTIDLFGIAATLGNIIYATTFLVTDIMSEVYGRKTALLAVFFGFFSLIITTVLMNLSIVFSPNSFDIAQTHLEAIFGFFPALTIASLLAFGVSQLHDIWSYNFWKAIRPEIRFIWLRNNLSTLVSQLLDSLIFILIATAFGVLPGNQFALLFLSTYLIKILVALLDTPFLYLAAWLKREGRVVELETRLGSAELS